MRQPPAEAWKGLLRSALSVADSLQTGYGQLDFRLGGGTVLMFRFEHRISNDIDVFFDNAQALSYLSPRLNEYAAGITDDYREQANSLKLVLPEGDVDFIVAGTVIAPGRDVTTQHLRFEGRDIDLDTTAEILAKKFYYRAETFKPRDVFDAVVASREDPSSLAIALDATSRRASALLRRLRDLSTLADGELRREIVFTDRGAVQADDMVARLIAIVEASLSSGDGA